MSDYFDPTRTSENFILSGDNNETMNELRCRAYLAVNEQNAYQPMAKLIYCRACRWSALDEVR